MSISILFAQLPTGFSSTMVQNGYSSPMGILFNSSGNIMFTWDRSGRVFASSWNGTRYIKQAGEVINISDEVGNWGDFGLESICIDPDFDTNGFLYLYYSVDRYHLLYAGTPEYDSTLNDYGKATIGRVTRYKLNLGAVITADYSSRRILIGESIKTGIPILYDSHLGGTLVFGRDKTLLLSTGESASYNTSDTGSLAATYYLQAIEDSIIRTEENVGAFRAQMVNSLSGKILRFDRNTGDGIASNPFFDPLDARSARSRVWAMGFRNPFRMAIQPGTGNSDPANADPGILLVGDVGWNTWEEFNIVPTGGLNFGWPLYEGESANLPYSQSSVINPDEGQLFGNLCQQPTSFSISSVANQRRFTHYRPSVTWKHGVLDARVPAFNGTVPIDPQVGASGSPTSGDLFRGNCAIGGVYYTGSALGASYQNKYFFADFIKGWIKTASLNTGTPLISNISNFGPENFAKGITNMQENPRDHSIFYSNNMTGEIRRISFSVNKLPVVFISSPSYPATFPAGSTISVVVNASDSDGVIKKVELFSGESKLGEITSAPYTFTGTNVDPGIYRVIAKATDDSNAVSVTDTLVVTVFACAGSGSITGEGYANIPGTQVADLQSNPAYPDNPSVTAQLPSFEYSSFGDNYGARLRGYICAPLTGNYTFYIAGDDQAGLFLSTDDNPANKVLICYNATSVGFRAWTSFPTQKSAPIQLTKGVKYYIETLHKQSTGANSLSVKWVMPNGVTEAPISGSRLSPIMDGPQSNASGFEQAMRATLEQQTSVNGLTVLVMPNPSAGIFNLKISSNSDEPVTILLTDMLGRVMAKRSEVSANGTVQIGQQLKTSGMYIAVVQQGTKKIQIKLLRQ